MRDRSVDNGAPGTAECARHLLDRLGRKQELLLEIQRLQNDNIELREQLLVAKMSQRETEQLLTDFHHLRDIANMPSSYTINLTEQYHKFSGIVGDIYYRAGRKGVKNAFVMVEDAEKRLIYITDERRFIRFNISIGDRVEVIAHLEPVSVYWPHSKWERLQCLSAVAIVKSES